jgi:hypothetical protein
VARGLGLMGTSRINVLKTLKPRLRPSLYLTYYVLALGSNAVEETVHI